MPVPEAAVAGLLFLNMLTLFLLLIGGTLVGTGVGMWECRWNAGVRECWAWELPFPIEHWGSNSGNLENLAIQWFVFFAIVLLMNITAGFFVVILRRDYSEVMYFAGGSAVVVLVLSAVEGLAGNGVVVRGVGADGVWHSVRCTGWVFAGLDLFMAFLLFTAEGLLSLSALDYPTNTTVHPSDPKSLATSSSSGQVGAKKKSPI